MMVLAEQTQNYISKFYEPEFSSYDFLKCFFAALYNRGKTEISRDIVDFLYQVKQTPEYKKVLHDIRFKSNGVFMYSNEIDDGIFNLQNVGLLRKKNPSFGVILIEFSDEIVEDTFSAISPEYSQSVNKIVTEYLALCKSDIRE